MLIALTDLQALKKMFEKAHIEYEEKLINGLVEITVYGGYAGFFSAFNFNRDGSLAAVTAWE